jgi:hypothetical protein
MRKFVPLAAVLTACAHASPAAVDPVQPTNAVPVTNAPPPPVTNETPRPAETGVLAVIYGLPLVLMDLTEQSLTNVAGPLAIAAPVNQFANAPMFPSAAFKKVVRANVDTLYSSAFLDLSKEPMVLSVPETKKRFYLMQLMDAWSNVLASPGTRTTGSGAANYAITGPEWTGTLPPGVQALKSPTNTVWILGRTETNGPADYAAVHAIQAGYKLVPLSAFGKPYTPPPSAVDAAIDMKTPPVDKLRAMSATAYFNALARLMKANPPAPADAPFVARLATIGIVPGQPFEPSKLDASVVASLDRSVEVAFAKIKEASKQLGTPVNGWHIPSKALGRFGTDYAMRAVIALLAFGANLPEDAVYPTAFVDGDGQHLNGANRYVLHFERGSEPPVNAFWSVTLYDSESFFVPNSIDRYAVSSWMPFVRNADGSLDIRVQKESPGKGKEQNWLPTSDGDFNLTMRLYWPKDGSSSILNGTWSPPAVRRVAGP